MITSQVSLPSQNGAMAVNIWPMAISLIARGAEQDADAEIEAVEQYVDEDREGDQRRPEHR